MKRIICYIVLWHFCLGSFSQKVLISEVLYDAPLYENDKDSIPSTHNGEFIELYNPYDNMEIDLSRWYLCSTNHVYDFPKGVKIKPKDYLLVCYEDSLAPYTIKDIFSAASLDESRIIRQNKLIIRNTDEQLKLINREGKCVSQVKLGYEITGGAHNGEKSDWSHLYSVQRNGYGFFCGKATPGEIKIDSVNLEEGLFLEFPYYADYKIIDVKLPVGGIAGEASISGSGAATYSIPVEVPPGLMNIQPSITIQYNSQGGNSLLGKGWSISGISEITCSLQPPYTGRVSGVSPWGMQGFYLDGVRLIYLGMSRYKTETNPFAEITYENNKFFKIVTEDGTVMRYGGDNESSVIPETGEDNYPLSYRLNCVTDTHGNYMEYIYSSSVSGKGENVIDEIRYTGNKAAGQPCFYSLKFNYVERGNKPRTEWVTGVSISYHKLLKSIEVVDLSSNSVLFAYEFKYIQDCYETPLLNCIRKSNGQGEKLNETIINWNRNYPAFQSKTVEINEKYPVAFPERYWTAGDFDGDGLSDLICTFPYRDPTGMGMNKTIVYYASSTEEGNVKFDRTQEINMQSNLSLGDEGDLVVGSPALSVLGHDGLPLLIYPVIEQKEDRVRAFTLSIVPRNGTGNVVELPLSGNSMPLYTYADLNNDGANEFFYIQESGIGKIIAFSDRRNPKFIGFNIETYRVGTPKKVLIADFNRDGLNDILLISDNGMFIYKNEGGKSEAVSGIIVPEFKLIKSITNIGAELDFVKIGDFNGDGLPDLICNRKDSENWFLALNNGRWGFDTKQIPLSVLSMREEYFTKKNNNEDDIVVMDFDNDGKDDLIVFDAKYEKKSDISGSWGEFKEMRVSWLTSWGSGFRIIRNSKIAEEPLYRTNSTNITGDFDGDGYLDFIRFGRNSYTNDQSIRGRDRKWRIYSLGRERHKTSLVTDISNGFNQRTSFDYTLLTGKNDSLYTSGSYTRYPVLEVVPSFPVLKSITVQNELDVPQKVSFRYTGYKIHMLGRGGMGFEKITSLHETEGKRKEQIVKVDRNGLLEYEEINDYIGETRISHERSNYGYREYGDGSRLMMLTSIKKENFLKPVSEIVTMEYDTITGHLIQEHTEYGNGAVMTYSYMDYVCGQAGRTICVKKHPDDDAVNMTETKKTFDEKGNLILQVHNPDTEKEVVIRYKNYTIQGMPGRKETETMTNSLTGENIIRWEEYTYDETNRFLLTSSDYLGITRYKYDNRGLITEKVTPGNLTESFVYDSWGNLVRATDSLGVTTEIVVEWAVNESPTSIYKVTTRNPGRSPMTVWYDAQNRIVLEETFGRNDMVNKTEYKYNIKGELCEVHQTVDDNRMMQVEYEYDLFGRCTRENYSSGKNITYSYAGGSVTTQIGNRKYHKVYDKQGLLLQTSDPGGTVSFNYSSVGKPSRIVAPNSRIELSYDEMGNRVKMTTEDLGTWTYAYDGLGNLTRQVDAHGNKLSVLYDKNGRQVSKYLNDRLYITYQYVKTGKGAGRLARIVQGFNNSSVMYRYNSYHQLMAESCRMPSGEVLVYEYGYDNLGRHNWTKFPENVKVEYGYDRYGNQTSVYHGETILWKSYLATFNSFTYELAGHVMVTKKYDSHHLLSEVQAKKLGNRIPFQVYRYNFARESGLLERRVLNGKEEVFTYDDLQRLTAVDLYTKDGQVKTYRMAYTENLMEYKTQAGNYRYQGSQLKQIVPDSLTDRRLLNGEDSLAYTPFGKVSSLCSDNYCYRFEYGPTEQRVYMELWSDGKLEKSVRYGKNYEKEVDKEGHVRHLYYIYAEKEWVGVLIKEDDGPVKPYAVYTDHQGSVIALSDENGNVVETYSYDPWGRRRDPLNPESDSIPEPIYLTRGYTGHEHLDKCNLINMNGRIYDPLLACFISVDNFIFYPEYTQSYNRYAYAVYNPMSYIDPQGQIVVAVIVGAIVGAYIGGVIGNEWEFNPGKWNFKSPSTWVGIGVGALGGAVVGSASIGSVAASLQVGKWVKVGIDFSWKYGKLAVKTAGWLTAAGGGACLGWEIYEVKHGKRPDDDKRLTFIEAKAWYLYGNGKPLTVDINSLDFSRVKRSDFNKQGEYPINMLHPFKPDMWTTLNDGLVYGQLRLVLNEGGNSFSIEKDTYDFDINWSNGEYMRNILTFMGHYWNEHIFLPLPLKIGMFPFPVYYRQGTPYEIYFQGDYKFK